MTIPISQVKAGTYLINNQTFVCLSDKSIKECGLVAAQRHDKVNLLYYVFKLPFGHYVLRDKQGKLFIYPEKYLRAVQFASGVW